MFSINDHEETAAPGTLVHLPAGTRHWFRFGTGGGEMLSIRSREAASRLFTGVDREISPDEPDFAKLVELSVRHGMEILVPRLRHRRPTHSGLAQCQSRRSSRAALSPVSSS
jgi:hypothetical protein